MTFVRVFAASAHGNKISFRKTSLGHQEPEEDGNGLYRAMILDRAVGCPFWAASTGYSSILGQVRLAANVYCDLGLFSLFLRELFFEEMVRVMEKRREREMELSQD